jgi:hypothetical protein
LCWTIVSHGLCPTIEPVEASPSERS